MAEQAALNRQVGGSTPLAGTMSTTKEYRQQRAAEWIDLAEDFNCSPLIKKLLIDMAEAIIANDAKAVFTINRLLRSEFEYDLAHKMRIIQRHHARRLAKYIYPLKDNGDM